MTVDDITYSLLTQQGGFLRMEDNLEVVDLITMVFVLL